MLNKDKTPMTQGPTKDLTERVGKTCMKKPINQQRSHSNLDLK